MVCCQRRLAAVEAELRNERRERAEHLQRLQGKLVERIGQAYCDKIKQLTQQVADQARACQEKIAAMQAEFAAKEQAYEAKLRDVISQLAMYKDSGPARTGSDKIDGTELTKKRDPKPHSPHGGGRKIPADLPTETVAHKLESSQCPNCGKALYVSDPVVSHEVQFEIFVRMIRHERQKVARCTCSWCGPAAAVPAAANSVDLGIAPKVSAAGSDSSQPALPATPPTRPGSAPGAWQQPEQSAPPSRAPALFWVAPLPPKAMTGSTLTDRAWIEVLMLKYVHQMALSQVVALLKNAAYNANETTLWEGLYRFSFRLLTPLIKAITHHHLGATLWAADASSLRMIEGGGGRTHGVVWQVRSQFCTVFFFTRTGEAKHIQEHFSSVSDSSRTLLVDRAATFQTLDFVIAFCWAHVRRDFIYLGRYQPGNRTFAIDWLQRIRQLYRLHRAWRKAPDEPERYDQFASHLDRMAKERDAELRREGLPEPRRKVLQSLSNHWTGLTRVLSDIRLPLDNNDVERNFRYLARFRQNSQGCHSKAGADVAMNCFTITRTLVQNKIPVKAYLLAWCDAIAHNGGKPPADLSPWLPWQLSEAVKQRIAYFRTA